MSSFTRTAEPATTPITTAEAKSHLRVDSSDDDTLIASLVAAATSWVEEYTGRQLVTATYLLTLDSFPDGPIILPRPPAISVTSITWTKSDETTDTVTSTDYVLDKSDDLSRHRIVLKDAFSWPSDTRDHAAVRVVYTAGYGAASAVPEVFKAAVKLVTANMYENRETLVVGTITSNLPTLETLLRNRRVDWI